MPKIICDTCYKDAEILRETDDGPPEVTIRCHDRTEIAKISDWKSPGRFGDAADRVYVWSNLKFWDEGSLAVRRNSDAGRAFEHAKASIRSRDVIQGQGQRRVDVGAWGSETCANVAAATLFVLEFVEVLRRQDVFSDADRDMLYQLFERAATAFAITASHLK